MSQLVAHRVLRLVHGIKYPSATRPFSLHQTLVPRVILNTIHYQLQLGTTLGHRDSLQPSRAHLLYLRAVQNSVLFFSFLMKGLVY